MNIESDEKRQSFDNIELSNIESRLRAFGEKIDSKLESINTHISCIKQTLSAERKLNELIDKYENKISILKTIFDTENLKLKYKEF